jgi:hypothetical protein
MEYGSMNVILERSSPFAFKSIWSWRSTTYSKSYGSLNRFGNVNTPVCVMTSLCKTVISSSRAISEQFRGQRLSPGHNLFLEAPRRFWYSFSMIGIEHPYLNYFFYCPPGPIFIEYTTASRAVPSLIMREVLRLERHKSEFRSWGVIMSHNTTINALLIVSVISN